MKEKLIKLDSNFISKKRSVGDILIVGLDESEVYYTINGISVELWEDLMSGKSLEKAQTDLIQKYPKHKNDLPKLISGFIKDLKKHKLISIEDK